MQFSVCKDGCCMINTVPRTYPRAAGIVCHDTKKDTFLLVQEKGKWGFPKARIGKKETSAEVAIRVFEEQTGIKVDEADLSFFGEAKGVDLYYVEMEEIPLVFTGEVDGIGYISKKCIKSDTFKLDFFMKFVQFK